MTLTRRSGLFAGFVACVSLANLPLLRDLIAHSSRNETASHVVLIPFVVIVLVWWDRQRIFAAPAFAAGVGIGVLLAGVALTAAVRFQWLPFEDGTALSASVFGLVVSWMGAFLAFFGTTAFRRALFPLLFLLFTAPIPEPALALAVAGLKNGSAHAVSTLFALSGTPYLREEFVFHLPSVSIEIADACSGIRSSIALLLTSLLIGHTYLDRGWKRLVLVLIVLPITLLKNGIRIVTLTLLAVHVDPSFLTGQLHHDGGVVFFALALGMLAPVVVLLDKGMPRFGLPRDVVTRQG